MRSPASLVTTACRARSAQITTCASTISAVPVRASKRPTAVASGPSSGMRSVPGCLINRHRRACLAGLRIACASAVAGTVARTPRSLARAMSASVLRSLRSRAIRPPASKVIPLTPPSFSWRVALAPGKREFRRPKSVPVWSMHRPSPLAQCPTFPSIQPRREERLQSNA